MGKHCACHTSSGINVHQLQNRSYVHLYVLTAIVIYSYNISLNMCLIMLLKPQKYIALIVKNLKKILEFCKY